MVALPDPSDCGRITVLLSNAGVWELLVSSWKCPRVYGCLPDTIVISIDSYIVAGIGPLEYSLPCRTNLNCKGLVNNQRIFLGDNTLPRIHRSRKSYLHPVHRHLRADAFIGLIRARQMQSQSFDVSYHIQTLPEVSQQ